MVTTINIKEGTILSKAGEGHVLVYSAEGDYYYAVPLSKIFQYEESSIKALREECTRQITELKENFEAFKKQIEEKIEDMDQADANRDTKVNKMISNYQESMNKVFEMVKQLQTEDAK